MGTFINTIDLLGDNAVSDALIEGTLEEFCDDRLTSVGSYAFSGCTRLTHVNLPNVTWIANGAFSGCTALKALVLSSEKKVCTLADWTLSDTSLTSSGIGYIYVPRALVDTYKTTKNWSNYASKIRALEDYTVDGTVTGELDESKI